MVDELIYSELAKSLADGDGFSIRGDAAAGAYGSSTRSCWRPAWALLDSVPAAYTAAKAINALAISLAVVPAYLLARRLVSQTGAFAVAVLTAALPSLLYAGMLMTENAFFAAVPARRARARARARGADVDARRCSSSARSGSRSRPAPRRSSSSRPC